MVSLLGRKVYLDSNTVIYALEGLAKFTNLRDGLLVPLDELRLTAVTSKLTLLEAAVFPRRTGDLQAEQNFRAFLTPTANKVIEPITDSVIERAIDLRARFAGLRTPDAIHIATGILTGCDLFITADKAWTKAGISVVDPSDI